jgi:hypothetical protein|tara:strand:- start:426 stop:578 length:153 start_codon:yes stop_codon:yes gene_type:complete
MDRETILSLLENAEIDFEDWNERMVTVDDRRVEFHFDSEGRLQEVLGAVD